MVRYRYLLLSVVIIGGLVFGFSMMGQKQPVGVDDLHKSGFVMNTVPTGVVSEAPTGIVSTSPTGVVTDASPANHEVNYVCRQGKSAYDDLAANYAVDVDDSSFGKFVKGINHQSQGEGKYWLYSVDGVEATVGASTYFCHGGERIVWELK